MPSVSGSQRRLFAIAEHHPDQLYSKNRSLLDLSRGVLHDFASTKGLKRQRVKKPRKPSGGVSLGSMMRMV